MGEAMKRQRWSVYRVVINGRKRKIIPLGYVNAFHQPAALVAAWNRWRNQADTKQVQNGFTVRPYATDSMSLGKKLT